jgi:hypothetical protein
MQELHSTMKIASSSFRLSPPYFRDRMRGISSWVLVFFLLLSSCHGLTNFNPVSSSSSQHDAPHNTATGTACIDSSNIHIKHKNLGLDVDRLRQTIASGRVYQQQDFLSPLQIVESLQEIRGLEESGAFERSGLSNTVKGQGRQNFGSTDRRTCAAPWWKDAIAGDYDKVSVNNTVALQLQQLRTVLANVLDRPTLKDNTLAHECYFSTASTGSFLSRHMDERHEELKGAKGWLLPSRRSLSWLVYLSDPGWDLAEHGGALRSFPQKTTIFNPSSGSQHDGHLQVGWLVRLSNGSSQPVYMDSWYQPPRARNFEPHCVLYCVDNDKKDRGRVLLTNPWLTDALQGMSVGDFVGNWVSRDAVAASPTLFLRTEDARQFALIEDRAAWDEGQDPRGSVVEDISPVRGSLVIFDSVSVPHQVEAIRKGRRVAMAGWFHEETQRFPEEFSTSS